MGHIVNIKINPAFLPKLSEENKKFVLKEEVKTEPKKSENKNKKK